jgi:putative ABC transport system permease protein
VTWLLVRLAFSGIRHRRLAAVLTVVLAGSAAATVVLALQVGRTIRDPWQQTFDAANGAHLLGTTATEDQARALGDVPGVTESAEPVPQAFDRMRLETSGGPVGVRLSAPGDRPAVNAPVAVTGTAIPGTGVVLERSLARALGLETGATVRLSGPGGDAGLAVVGTAVLPSQARYPRSNPGLVWVGTPTLRRLAPDGSAWRWAVGLRIADPQAAPAAVEAIRRSVPGDGIELQTWQEQRADAEKDSAPIRLILTMYAVVLLAVVFTVVSILAGARALQQHRELGLLKAVGLTPRQVTAIFVLESAALGLVAALLGFAVGTLLAPQLSTATSDALLGSPAVAVDLGALLVAAVPVLLVLVLSSWAATRRRTQFSVLQAIDAGRQAPPSRSRVAGLIGRLPLSVPVAVGARTMLAGRGRVVLLGTAITLVGAMFVFALSMQASLAELPEGRPTDVPAELPVAVYTLDAVLLVIAFTSLLAVALLSLRERLRDLAVLKTLGLTPRQVASTLASPYTVLAWLAGVVSVPVGIALYLGAYRVAGGDGDPVVAAWPWLVVVPFATALLVLAAVGGPATLATRTPAAMALRAE